MISKRFIVLSLISLLSQLSFGQQSEFYDAKFIVDNCLEKGTGKFINQSRLYEVLKKHYPNSPLSEQELGKNPFLKPFVPVAIAKSVPTSQSFQDNFSKLTNADISVYADGLAKFLVKRAKQELTTSFFDRFYKELDKQKDLQEFFPSTYSILKTASSEIYNYQTYLPALREAFQHDINDLLPNSFAWTKTNQGELIKYLQQEENKKAYALLKLLLFSANKLENGTHPGDLVAMLVDFDSPDPKYNEDKVSLTLLDTNLKPALQTVDLFSQSVRSNDPARYWISETEWSSFRDTTFQRIYLGLVYQGALNKKITYSTTSGTKDLHVLLADFVSKVDDKKHLIQFWRERINATQNAIELLKDKQKITVTELLKIANFGIELTNDFQTNTVLSAIPSKLGVGYYYAKHVSLAWSYLQSQSYNSAVFEVYSILDSALSKSGKRDDLKKFLKYGTLISSVASAKSSDEVEQAIEAIALPPGSSAMKTSSAFNITLNAYLGGSFGHEIGGNSQFAGLMTPIGIAFNFGISGKGVGAISVFASIMDIGAFATYRFEDPNTDLPALPEATFQNIWAPGGYLVLGRIANTPLALMTGFQYGPAINKVTSTGATVEDPFWRFSVGITVDLPLVNFYFKPKK